MSYPAGTKVVCIDATPIPIRVGKGITGLDFTFPKGFIEEGQIYCVTGAHRNPDGSYGLYLAGLPILIRGATCNWHHTRFRLVTPKRKHLAKKEKAPNPSP